MSRVGVAHIVVVCVIVSACGGGRGGANSPSALDSCLKQRLEDETDCRLHRLCLRMRRQKESGGRQICGGCRYVIPSHQCSRTTQRRALPSRSKRKCVSVAKYCARPSSTGAGLEFETQAIPRKTRVCPNLFCWWRSECVQVLRRARGVETSVSPHGEQRRGEAVVVASIR